MIRALALAAIAACAAMLPPTPTGATCPSPDPLTPPWTDFGQPFMTRYCTMCHSSVLNRPDLRNGAPLFHDFDTLLGVMEVPDHIDEQAGAGPKARNEWMPPARCPSTPGGPLDEDCPQPSDAERTMLSLWISCERDRPHAFTRPDVRDVPLCRIR